MTLQTFDPPEPPPPNPQQPSFVPEDPFSHGAERHLRVIAPDGEVLAGASLWHTDAPPFPDERLGVIGHYYARTDEAGMEILQAATQDLRERGATVAIGPMDGNTWRRYRLITQRYHEPSFFLEPDHPAGWPMHFIDSDFYALARYTSALLTRLERPDPRLEPAVRRLEANGTRLRPLDLEQFEEELRRIHRVSVPAFQKNFLYTPLPEKDFVEQYLPLKQYLAPETVLLAEADDEPVGFAFAIPDLLEREREGEIQTLILKTLAVLPGRKHAGLGTVLAGEIRRRAHKQGYRRLIHALMHQDNVSRNLGKTDSETIREYTLYAKRLAPSKKPLKAPSLP